jgi:alkylation response protein AidB-like acyl-CoA dehydrogenase
MLGNGSRMLVYAKHQASELRLRALAAVEAIGPLLESENAEAERLRAPTASMIKAMREAGLLGLKSPHEVGGDEADWPLQIDVLGRMAYYSISAAWCYMIYIDNIGSALANISDAGLARIIPNGEFPVICGGGGLHIGQLTKVPGGYRITGHWTYGSGIAQAEYVNVLAMIPPQGETQPQMFSCLLPVNDIELIDNWHVMGVRGSGSCDFAANDLFISDELVFAASLGVPKPKRGGDFFHLSPWAAVTLVLPAVMIGGTQRALDELTKSAASKARGYGKKVNLAERQVFQNFIGESDLALKAARNLMYYVGNKVLDDVRALGDSPEANDAEIRATGAYCAKIALEVMNGVVRYMGGAATQQGHLFERTLRDLHMAGTHMFINDIVVEQHGQFLMGLPYASAAP